MEAVQEMKTEGKNAEERVCDDCEMSNENKNAGGGSEHSSKKMTLEEAMIRLEEIVNTLRDGNLSLENALQLFEEGVNLCKFCNKKLDEAEFKVQMLIEEEDGIKIRDMESTE